MDKVLFENTYTNHRTNGANRKYWVSFFLNEICSELNENNVLNLHPSFDEDMPIYEYFSLSKQRFVRIMQYNPKDPVIVNGHVPYDCFTTAWIDNREYCEGVYYKNKPQVYPELVVALLMTENNLSKVKKLIKTWLFDPDLVNGQIQAIYDAQYIPNNE